MSSPAALQYVRTERDGDTLTVVLDHPARRNALSLDVMNEVLEAVRAAGETDALAVVISAEGPVFSAGHDFADMRDASLDDLRRLFAVCVEMMESVQRIPQPVIARVHALATAAGCQLVASCDLAIAAESAGFALPGAKGGLFCHTPLVAVSRSIGRKRALEMALTGDVVDAATAADWGLINRAVPDAELDDAVADLVRRVTRGSATSKAAGKRGFYDQIDLAQPAAYEHAAELMASSATTVDAQEAFAAFFDKRHPEFTRPGPRDAAGR